MSNRSSSRENRAVHSAGAQASQRESDYQWKVEDLAGLVEEEPSRYGQASRLPRERRDESADAPTVLQGTVVHGDSGLKVEGATVWVAEGDARTTSARDGSFSLEVPIRGLVRLRASWRSPEGLYFFVERQMEASAYDHVDVVISLRAASRVTVAILNGARRTPLPKATVQLLPGGPVLQADDSGLAVLSNLAPGSYEAVAQAPGFRRRRMAFHLARKEDLILVLELFPATQVRGQVRNEHGNEVKKGTASLFREAGGLAVERAPIKEGFFLLHEVEDSGDPWSLLIEAPGFAPQWRALAPDEIARGRLAVMLQRGHLLEGVVTHQKQPVEGASVLLWWHPGLPPRRAGTDQYGHFLFEHVSTEDIVARLTIDAPGRAQTSLQVTLPSPALRVDLPLGIEFHGRVTAEDGSPVPGAEATLADEPSPALGGRLVLANADGRFCMPDIRNGSRIWVRHRDFTPLQVLARPSEAKQPTPIVLTRSQVLFGQVVDAATEAPIQEGRVFLLVGTHSGAPLYSGTALQEGAFTAAGLPRGQVMLLVQAAGYPLHQFTALATHGGEARVRQQFRLLRHSEARGVRAWKLDGTPWEGNQSEAHLEAGVWELGAGEATDQRRWTALAALSRELGSGATVPFAGARALISLLVRQGATVTEELAAEILGDE